MAGVLWRVGVHGGPPSVGGVLVGQSCRGHSFGGGVYVGDGVSVGFMVGVSLIPPRVVVPRRMVWSLFVGFYTYILCVCVCVPHTVITDIHHAVFYVSYKIVIQICLSNRFKSVKLCSL